MRFKSRYFLCELVLEEPRWRQNISQGTVLYNVREAIARTHGDFGAAACSTSLSVKYLNAYTGIILLRCRKDFYQLLWTSIPFITSLDNRGQRCPCFINTLHVGGLSLVPKCLWLIEFLHTSDVDFYDEITGTIRSCQKFLIQYNKNQLQLLLKNCTNAEERQAIQKSIASCSLQAVEETDTEFMLGEEEEND